MLPALLLVNPFGPPVGWILLIGLLRHPLVLFKMFGMCIRDVLGVVPGDVVLALRNAASRSAVDDFLVYLE